MGESHHFIRENDGLYKIGQKLQVLLEKVQFKPVFDLRSENAVLARFCYGSILVTTFTI